MTTRIIAAISGAAILAAIASHIGGDESLAQPLGDAGFAALLLAVVLPPLGPRDRSAGTKGSDSVED